jgi:hypothetical protein
MSFLLHSTGATTTTSKLQVGFLKQKGGERRRDEIRNKRVEKERRESVDRERHYLQGFTGSATKEPAIRPPDLRDRRGR